MAWSQLRELSSHGHPSFEGFSTRGEVEAPDSLGACKHQAPGHVRTVVEKGGSRMNTQGSLTGTWHSGSLNSDQEFRRIPDFSHSLAPEAGADKVCR